MDYLIVDHVVPLEDFDFFNRFLIAGPDNDDLIDIDIIWWANDVFPTDADHKRRFSYVMDYFFSLQALFGARRLFMASENSDWPPESTGIWVEV